MMLFLEQVLMDGLAPRAFCRVGGKICLVLTLVNELLTTLVEVQSRDIGWGSFMSMYVR